MAKRTKLHHQYGHLRALAAGFSLVELMVALAIAGFLTIGLWALMASQNTTYRVQDNASQVQQNLRAAVDRVSRDLLSAGQGPPWQMTMNGKTCTWYVLSPSCNFGQPYNISANQIDIIGTVGSGSTGGIQTALASAASGTSKITVTAGQGQYFPVGTYLDVGDEGAYESAEVTAVAGDTLTIDTNPGKGQALQGSYAAGTNVYPLQWITYSMNLAVNPVQLVRDQHDGNGPQAIAYGITLNTPQAQQAYSPSTNDGGSVQITFSGSTPGPNSIQSTAVSIVHMRNL